jgi:hypothetical protein
VSSNGLKPLSAYRYPPAAHSARDTLPHYPSHPSGRTCRHTFPQPPRHPRPYLRLCHRTALCGRARGCPCRWPWRRVNAQPYRGPN